MRISILFAFFLMLQPSLAVAANVVRQTMDIENSANPRMACQNPKFNFNRQETEICLGVYQGCLRPDFKQSEREQCIVDAVRKGKTSTGQTGGSPGAQGPGSGPRVANIDFSFNSFQAYDLIEVCEQKQNKNRPLCSGAILPNKAKIISDINKARQ